MKKNYLILILTLVLTGCISHHSHASAKAPKATDTIATYLPIDHLEVERAGSGEYVVADGDTIYLYQDPLKRHGPLTEQDYLEVARELGVEVAAIKAVVDIEAGREHKGFWMDGKPLINFDLTMFRQMAARNKINLGKYSGSHSVVFSRPNIKKYGSQQAAQQARLDSAMDIDYLTAMQGTFWGMFQIGGFNWKRCGASSPEEFVMLMSRSERDQLELFAEFITQAGLVKHLKSKNWSAFARGYNGPSYASRGYHTRLANAYARHKKNS